MSSQGSITAENFDTKENLVIVRGELREGLAILDGKLDTAIANLRGDLRTSHAGIMRTLITFGSVLTSLFTGLIIKLTFFP